MPYRLQLAKRGFAPGAAELPPLEPGRPVSDLRIVLRKGRTGFGRVVNISSVHGLRASAYKVAYVTAKHALEGMSKVTAIEGGPHGVTSNCVNPGYVRTPLVENQIADQSAAHGISEDEVLAKVMLTESAIKRL